MAVTAGTAFSVHPADEDQGIIQRDYADCFRLIHRPLQSDLPVNQSVNLRFKKR